MTMMGKRLIMGNKCEAFASSDGSLWVGIL